MITSQNSMKTARKHHKTAWCIHAVGVLYFSPRDIYKVQSLKIEEKLRILQGRFKWVFPLCWGHMLIAKKAKYIHSSAAENERRFFSWKSGIYVLASMTLFLCRNWLASYLERNECENRKQEDFIQIYQFEISHFLPLKITAMAAHLIIDFIFPRSYRLKWYVLGLYWQSLTLSRKVAREKN